MLYNRGMGLATGCAALKNSCEATSTAGRKLKTAQNWTRFTGTALGASILDA